MSWGRPLWVGLVLSATAAGAVPSLGVPVEVRHGLFLEADVGAFFTLGGGNAYSNLQTFLQLGAGYTFTALDGALLVPVAVRAGVGANAQNCWTGLGPGGACTASDSFALAFFDLGTAVLFRVGERLHLGPGVQVGATLLAPPPRPDLAGQLQLGASLRLDYATALDHLSVGLEVSYRLVLGLGLSAIAIYPRVQYTF
jgi:hypothetical protein